MEIAGAEKGIVMASSRAKKVMLVAESRIRVELVVLKKVPLRAVLETGVHV